MIARKSVLLLFFLLIGVNTSFANTIDSLLNELEIISSQSDNSKQLVLHHQISQAYFRVHDYSKALSFAERGLAQQNISINSLP